MANPTVEDIAAMRAQGKDFAEYLRLLTGGEEKPAPVKAAPAPVIAEPARRPGVWPAGTRPAGPDTCDPGCDCAITGRPTA